MKTVVTLYCLPNYYFAASQTYRTASVPYATPTHTRKSAQLIPIRNSVLSIKELYLASNIFVSPLASIDGCGPLSLVNTRKNLVRFHSGSLKLFFDLVLTPLELDRPQRVIRADAPATTDLFFHGSFVRISVCDHKKCRQSPRKRAALPLHRITSGLDRRYASKPPNVRNVRYFPNVYPIFKL